MESNVTLSFERVFLTFSAGRVTQLTQTIAAPM
jgi:hypothetical protein